MDYLSKIAEELRISRSSVYRAIKHMKPMSSDMRKKVVEYIKTNYPEKLAQLNSFNENLDSKHIVVIMPYKPEYFWEEAASGMEAAIKGFSDHGIDLKYIFYAGTISEEELISILDSIEVNSADALCVVPANSEKVADKINEISGRMPVAIFNECCHGAVPFLNIVSDGYAEGCIIGNMVKEQCPSGSHTVMIITDSYKSDVFDDRIRGFNDSLKAAFDDGREYFFESVKIESNQRYNYHTILPSLIARKVNECIERVAAKGGQVKATYVINGALLPLCIALRKMDRPDISVFGHEINANALEFFESGMRGGYVRQDIYEQGYAVINGLANKLLYNKKIYPETYNTRIDSKSYFGKDFN